MNESFRYASTNLSNSLFDGRQRVVIENVSPELDGGKYPSKHIIGENIVIEADIFVDGADTLAAELCMRKQGETAWQRTPMNPTVNDRWSGTVTGNSVGLHEYTIEARVNHFATWLKGLRKKIDAGQDVRIDMQIGARHVEAGAERATGTDAVTLRIHAARLLSAEPEERETAAFDQELTALMERNPDRHMATSYDRIIPLRIEPENAGCSAWYEFFPRSWAAEAGTHGTFTDCQLLLPMIAGMGFDVIYLPPIHPIGHTKRKGRNNALVAAPGEPGSCWAIGNQDGGHKSVHPELGSMDDFVTFVTEARQRGIAIALDIAFQCSPDHPYVEKHPEWFIWRPDGTVQFAENPPKRYEDILPINFESDDWENLWIELRSIFLFWIEKGVRIFRVDNPHTKAFPFWEWAIATILEQHPDIIFLAEAFTRPKLMARLAKTGYTQSYSYFTWRNTKEELQSYVTELTTAPLKHFMRPNFWPNTPDILHEELQRGERETFIIRFVLAATLSSNYGMYGPAYELCEHIPVAEGKEEYRDSEKYEIKRWDLDRPGNIRAEITKINRIRKENKALRQTSNVTFVRIDASAGNEHQLLTGYLKRSDDDSNLILTVVSLDPHQTQSGWLRFPLELFGLHYQHRFTVEELMSGNRYDWNGEWNYIEIRPHSMPAQIFRITLM